jgi:hypothetical protein
MNFSNYRFCSFLVEKKVVKRKAESTTDESHDLIIAESIEGLTRQRNGKKMLTRREHGLQVKKPNKDLPTPIASPPLAPPKRVPLNTSMKYCLDFVTEMLSKKHIEYAWPFYEPVSTQLYPDYLTIIKKPMDLSTIKVSFSFNFLYFFIFSKIITFFLFPELRLNSIISCFKLFYH